MVKLTDKPFSQAVKFLESLKFIDMSNICRIHPAFSMRSAVRSVLLLILIQIAKGAKQGRKRPNVIVILADDLGYGDLGWGPFVGEEMHAVRTPHLQAMASQGMTMTNFHTASPVCSPSRASIMVGLFPWRMGVDFIYAGGKAIL